MKKSLISIAVIGLAMASCSHDFEFTTVTEEVTDVYKAAFVEAFGTPAPTQTWGFGEDVAAARTRAFATRSGNTGETYPATHGDANGGANMNHNEWADPAKEFGGWVVVDPLTQKQKDIVTAYFQNNQYPDYEDPHFRHFFVQQVYKGGKTEVGETTEGITAANNSSYSSDNMNLLTVGATQIHINDYNAGTCSESNVLDNGQSVGGSSHKDQITLMVNIDDTSCFGYHETGSSTHHNNKAGLVGWETIRTWANANGYDGDCLNDGWNRSFLGFDLALKEGAEAYATNEQTGEVQWATFDQAPEAPVVAWDGEKVIEIADITREYPDYDNNPYWYNEVKTYKDEYKTLGVGYLTTNQNFYTAADKVTLSQTYQNGEIQASTLTDVKDAVCIKDLVYNGTKYQCVINLPKINQLISDGYLPVMNTSLTNWVKVGVSDGYYSDWIVTLTEAKRIINEKWGDPIRVIAEDLSVNQRSDFDFNDVVFDVSINEAKTKAKITLKAAGGTLPLTVGWSGEEGTNYLDYEVHELYKVSVGTMVNTHASNGADNLPDVTYVLTGTFNNANDVKVMVQKRGEWVEMTAHQGEPASKIAVGTDYVWCDERENITDRYSNFTTYVQEGTLTEWWHAVAKTAEE